MTKKPEFQNSKTPNKLKNKKSKTYDLENRLEEFFENVIKLCKKYSLNARTSTIVSQLTASA